MDDKMIIDFINNVQPDMSYGTSDGMTRAMVESAENMAVVNDYITESTYEVYTEAEEDKDNKQGFFSKVGIKISAYFTLFMNITKKFITKVKGFFVAVKRKLTVAMAKALKAIGEFYKNHAKFNSDTGVEVEIYEWNTVRAAFDAFFEDNNIDKANYTSAEESKKIVDGLKTKLSQLLKEDMLDVTKVTVNASNAKKIFEEHFKESIDNEMNTVYNNILTSSKNAINELNAKEKDVKARIKKATSKEELKQIKDELKGINIMLNGINSIKYSICQKVASTCVRIYKKLFSAVRKAAKAKKGDTAKASSDTKQESVLDLIK